MSVNKAAIPTPTRNFDFSVVCSHRRTGEVVVLLTDANVDCTLPTLFPLFL